MEGLKDLRKNIDIKGDIVKPLKVLAVYADKDLKTYIEQILINHVNDHIKLGRIIKEK